MPSFQLEPAWIPASPPSPTRQVQEGGPGSEETQCPASCPIRPLPALGRDAEPSGGRTEDEPGAQRNRLVVKATAGRPPSKETGPK